MTGCVLKGTKTKGLFPSILTGSRYLSMKYRFKLADPNKNTTCKQAHLRIKAFMSWHRRDITPMIYKCGLNIHTVFPDLQSNFKIEILIEVFCCSKLLGNHLSCSVACSSCFSNGKVHKVWPLKFALWSVLWRVQGLATTGKRPITTTRSNLSKSSDIFIYN